MESVERIEEYLQPLRMAIVVQRTPAEAFAVFTERFGAWWPRDRFSIHQAASASCGIEPRVGAGCTRSRPEGSGSRGAR